MPDFVLLWQWIKWIKCFFFGHGPLTHLPEDPPVCHCCGDYMRPTLWTVIMMRIEGYRLRDFDDEIPF